jgi:hypothetical protein
MPDTHLGKLASWLLSCAIALCPSDVRPWGDAMLAELRHIQGGWAILSWAVGGVSVLVTQVLVSLFRGPNRGGALLPAPPVFVKEGPMRKVIPLLAGVSVAVSCLFLLAPSFRQGMEISLGIWRAGFDNGASYEQSLLELAAQARKQHDAEVMAFVALRLRGTSDSDELADEVVKLNPQLTWVYSMYPDSDRLTADAEVRKRKLEAWDPQNAVPYLMEANLIFDRKCREQKWRDCGFGFVKDDPRWPELMAAAFRAPNYDSYLARRLDLDRAVMRRLHLHDPLLFMTVGWIPYGAGHIRIYAEHLLDSAKDFEAKGDLSEASKLYSSVAHFCQLVQTEGQTDFERMSVTAFQLEAYRRMQTLAERSGNLAESNLLSYEIQQLNRQRVRRGERQEAFDAYRWVGAIVQASFLVVVFSAGLTLLWAGSKLSRRFIGRLRTGYWPSLFSWAATVGATGLLFGTLTLYLSYQPYAGIFNEFMASTGAGQFRSLGHVWSLMWPAGWLQPLSDDLRVYFWYAFIGFATCVLIFVLGRMLRKDLRLPAAG